VNGFFLWFVLLVTVASGACSGGRDDLIGGECVTDRQCATGEACVTGLCTGTSSDSASVTGKVAGAPEDVRIETRAGDELCEDRGSRGIVCMLATGTSLTLVAPVVDGYRFSGWSGGTGCTSDAPELALEKLKKSVVCTANYVRRVRVTGEVAGEGSASVIASSESAFSACKAGSCEVDAGAEVVLLAPVRDGFRLAGVEGEQCQAREGYRITVSTGESDVTCSASYVDSLTVKGQTTGLGEAADRPEAEVKARSPWEGALCEGPLCAIDPDQTVILSAPEVPGFRFRGWVGDPACLSSEPELTLEHVTSNITCSADYVTRHTVRGISEGVANAPIRAESDTLFAACKGDACVVDRGESVTLTAGTVDGYRLSAWSGEGCEPLPGASAIARNVEGELVCTAHYVAGVSVSGTLVNVAGEVDARSGSPGADCSRGTCAIDVGGEVQLSAPRLQGRTFLGWSGSPGCEGQGLTITLTDVTSSKACQATYAARYRVAASTQPRPGGMVSASARGPNANCSGASCEVDESSSVTLTAAAASSYRFTGWTGGGPCQGLLERLELPNVRSSVTCTANFVLRVRVSGVASPREAASVAATQLSLGGDCTGNACTVDAGSDVTLRATANDGWQFVNWTGCGNLLNPILDNPTLPLVTVGADTECTANFKKLTYPVQALASAGGSASASRGPQPCPGGICQVPYDEGATLTAVPADGYDFVAWTGAGCAGGAVYPVSGIRAPLTCTATFAIRKVSLTGNAGGVPLAPTPSATAAGSCAGSSCTVDWGSTVTLTAVVAPGEFRFEGWGACAGGTVSGASGEVMTVTNLRESQTCTANYARRIKVTTSESDPTLATTNCRNGCWVDGGMGLEISVEPKPGYQLYSWDCGAGDSGPAVYEYSRIITPTADTTCRAVVGAILG
jgi:Divergent InlB B-repeat domain